MSNNNPLHWPQVLIVDRHGFGAWL